MDTIALKGVLRQSDAEGLRQRALTLLGAGEQLHFDCTGLEAIEFGPLQVLLCAAAEARRLGLACEIGPGSAVLDKVLREVRLPDAATLFSPAQTSATR